MAQHGGCVEGAVRERAVAAAGVVLRQFPSVRLRVLDTEGLVAYSWPDGTIVVSRGLVGALTDEELAAAVAHELGHLISDGWVETPAALSGRHAERADVEERADAVGVEVLRECGMSARVLAGALKKVQGAGGLTAGQSAGIERRIELLEVCGG